MTGDVKEEVVVRTDTGTGEATVLRGGYLIGVRDGTILPCADFNRRIPVGVPCLFNPRPDGDERLRRIFSRRNGA